VWNFQIAASIEEYYYQYNNTSEAPELLWFDSDSSSVLLLTKNLTLNSSETESLLNGPLAFDLFVQPSDMTAMSGLENSVCGMQQNAPIEGLITGDGRQNNLISASITTSGVGGFPKQQFYLSGLNKSTTYVGVLTVPSRDSPDVVNSQRAAGTAGGGGTSFGPTTFSTTASKSSNTSICHQVFFFYQADWCCSYQLPSHFGSPILHQRLVFSAGERQQVQRHHFSSDLRQLRQGDVQQL
jgi:calcium channel MID1